MSIMADMGLNGLHQGNETANPAASHVLATYPFAPDRERTMAHPSVPSML
jgi:hypothetical protein